MATGRKPFKGESQASLIGAILRDDPPAISELQPLSPTLLDRTIKKCLSKDADDRWQSAGDLRAQLEWTRVSPRQNDDRTPNTNRSKAKAWILWVAALVMLAAVSFWALLPSSPRPEEVPTRLSLQLPGEHELGEGIQVPFAFSPDGKELVYVARTPDGKESLYLRQLGSFDARPIPGSEGARGPFFSPDGEWVGFATKNILNKVALSGGPVQTICEIPLQRTGWLLATWTPADTIIFSVGQSPLFIVDARGGEVSPLTTLDVDGGETGHWSPHILPDGKTVLFHVVGSHGNQVQALSLVTKDHRTLVENASSPRLTQSGHLVFMRSNQLWGGAFDTTQLTLTGPPTLLVDEVALTNGGAGYFSVSNTGSLIYLPSGYGVQRRLVWVDRKGQRTALAADPFNFHRPGLSPDDQNLVVTLHEADGHHDLWVYDIERRTRSRLTVEGDNEDAVWTPDGSRIVFSSARTGGSGLYWKSPAARDEAEPLLLSEDVSSVTGELALLRPCSWSPDGSVLAFEKALPGGVRDIWILDHDGKASPLIATEFNEHSAAFSPDGRWIAFVSNESGREEVYVQSYPDGESRWILSTDGGFAPRWSGDGKELFYRWEYAVFSVPVQSEPRFEPGVPGMLFENYDAMAMRANFLQYYDVAADGRFVIVESTRTQPSGPGVASGPRSFRIVLNWFDELEQLVSRN